MYRHTSLTGTYHKHISLYRHPVPAHLLQAPCASTPLTGPLCKHTSYRPPVQAHLLQAPCASTPLTGPLCKHTSYRPPMPAHITPQAPFTAYSLQLQTSLTGTQYNTQFILEGQFTPHTLQKLTFMLTRANLLKSHLGTFTTT